MASSSSPDFLRWFGNLRCCSICSLLNFVVALCICGVLMNREISAFALAATAEASSNAQ